MSWWNQAVNAASNWKNKAEEIVRSSYVTLDRNIFNGNLPAGSPPLNRQQNPRPPQQSPSRRTRPTNQANPPNLWSRLDQAVNGWLPGGGVASPLTKIHQNKLKTLKEDRQANRPLENSGPFVNALAASTAASVNPISLVLGDKAAMQQLAHYYRNNPEQTAFFDLPTDMFLRYVSGIGADGLVLSKTQQKAILESAQEGIRRMQDPAYKSLSAELLNHSWPGSKRKIYEEGLAPVWFANSSYAEAPVKYGQFKDGPIGREQLPNSLGSYFVKKTKEPGQLEIEETYNFNYAPASKGGIKESQERVRRMALLDKLNPTNAGRSIVSTGIGTPYSYKLEINPDGSVLVK